MVTLFLTRGLPLPFLLLKFSVSRNKGANKFAKIIKRNSFTGQFLKKSSYAFIINFSTISYLYQILFVLFVKLKSYYVHFGTLVSLFLLHLSLSIATCILLCSVRFRSSDHHIGGRFLFWYSTSLDLPYNIRRVVADVIHRVYTFR